MENEIFYDQAKRVGGSLMITIPHNLLKAMNWDEKTVFKILIKEFKKEE